MIIPIKCFTCGTVIADKYRFYVQEVRKKKLAKKGNDESIDIDKVLYLTKESMFFLCIARVFSFLAT
jgi:DNA-directed RNA polymerase I, II, and III subunit RPABC5